MESTSESDAGTEKALARLSCSLLTHSDSPFGFSNEDQSMNRYTHWSDGRAESDSKTSTCHTRAAASFHSPGTGAKTCTAGPIVPSALLGTVDNHTPVSNPQGDVRMTSSSPLAVHSPTAAPAPLSPNPTIDSARLSNTLARVRSPSSPVVPATPQSANLAATSSNICTDQSFPTCGLTTHPLVTSLQAGRFLNSTVTQSMKDFNQSLQRLTDFIRHLSTSSVQYELSHATRHGAGMDGNFNGIRR